MTLLFPRLPRTRLALPTRAVVVLLELELELELGLGLELELGLGLEPFQQLVTTRQAQRMRRSGTSKSPRRTLRRHVACR